MSVRTFNRRLLQIEAKHYVRVVQAKEIEDKAEEIRSLLKTQEEFTGYVAKLSLKEKHQFAKGIIRDYETMPLTADVEPYRDSFKNAMLSNLRLHEMCKEVQP